MGELSPPVLRPPTPLTPQHDCSGFDCAEAALNDWLKKRAWRNELAGASRCFVVCRDTAVVAYYTLSAAGIGREVAPKSMQRNMPDPLPALLLGRLAVDRRYQSAGLGKALLRDAMIRTLAVSAEAGIIGLLVHAMSEPARRFYLSRGFLESPLQPMTLFLPIGTLRAAMLE